MAFNSITSCTCCTPFQSTSYVDLLQEIFKAVAQFVKEIQAGGPVQKGGGSEAQTDKAPTKTAVNVTSTSSSAPPQVVHLTICQLVLEGLHGLSTRTDWPDY